MTAIVTDAHYRMSVALIRDLGQAGVRVIACEKERFPVPVGGCSRYAAACRLLPEADYAGALFRLCREELEAGGEKPVVLPVGAETLGLLARERERFSAVCSLLVPTPEQLALLNDKAAVHALARRLGVPVPRTFRQEPEEPEAAFFRRVPLPCVVKPLCGEQFGLPAAARYRVARTPEQLREGVAHFAALTRQAPLVQEYLPGGGLGCSVLCDRGRVVCAIGHRRIREYPVTGGPSSCCRVEDPGPLLPFVRALAAETGFTGCAMFEFKEDAEGRPRLLEVNPRVWGTYPLTRVSGSNFALCWLALAAGQPLPAWQGPKPVKMVFYPSDLAAMAGALRRGRFRDFFSGLLDALDPRVKNGLAEGDDPGPGRAYFRQLLEKRRQS